MKHDELQESLAVHLRGATDRMVWTNTQLGPSGSPRPDVFTLAKSFSKFRADCYECKVSVSDLRHDVTSGKWQAYRKFGHTVWFAFPRGLAPLELVPKECGVILLGEGWRAARKPVAQVLDTLPRDAWLKLVMDLHPIDFHGRVRAPRTGAEYRAADIIRRKVGDELARLFSNVEAAKGALQHRQDMENEAIKRFEAGQAERMARQRENDRLVVEALASDVRELGEVLGLSGPEIDARAVRDAVLKLRRRLHEAGINDAIRHLEVLRGAIAPAEGAAA